MIIRLPKRHAIMIKRYYYNKETGIYQDGVYSEKRGFKGGIRLFGLHIKIVALFAAFLLLIACPSEIPMSEQTGDVDEEVLLDSCGLPIPVPLQTITKDTFIK